MLTPGRILDVASIPNSVKREAPDLEAWSKPVEGSSFTADNSIQSGGRSLPPAARATSSGRSIVEPGSRSITRRSTASQHRIDGPVTPETEEAQRSVFEVCMLWSPFVKAAVHSWPVTSGTTLLDRLEHLALPINFGLDIGEHWHVQ